MKKILLVFAVLLYPFSSSFSQEIYSDSYRQDIINEALTQLELVDSSAEDIQDTEYFAENTLPFKISSPEKERNLRKKGEEETRGTISMSWGWNANHMHYKEFDSNDNTLDEDYGALKGYYFNFRYKMNQYMQDRQSKPFFEYYYLNYKARITYDGASSAGPLEFKERAYVQRYGLKAGIINDKLFDNGNMALYLDLGQRVWYRGDNDIVKDHDGNSVLTYAEKYWWTYLGGGIGFDCEVMPRLTAGIEFELMGSPKSWSRMRADLYEGGTFKLRGVLGIDLKIPIKYYIFKNFSFDVVPYFTYWDITKSDPVLINGASYYEPDSKTYIEGILIGFTNIF